MAKQPDGEWLEQLAHAARAVAHAIFPAGAVGGTDEAGVEVASLTEAVMGVTAGLVMISKSIDLLASAVSDLAERQS